jgi:hypothetical protein
LLRFLRCSADEWTVLSVNTSAIDQSRLSPDNYELQDLIDSDGHKKLRGIDRWSDVSWELSLETTNQIAYLGDIFAGQLSISTGPVRPKIKPK